MPPHPVLPLSQLPTRIPAETVRGLVHTVSRNFDAPSTADLKLQTASLSFQVVCTFTRFNHARDIHCFQG